jgi:hypothetical protein
MVWGLRVFFGALGVGGVVGLLTATIHGMAIGGVCLGTAVMSAAVVEPIIRRERRMLRDGVAAIARIVPAETPAGDVALRALVAAGRGGRLGPRLGYEYATGRGPPVRTSRLLAWLGPTPAVFPEGTEVGARFVVLFDPEHPERNVPYRPASLYRIRPPS